MTELNQRKCSACERGLGLLSDAEADALLQQIPKWIRDQKTISRTYAFKNYYQTIAFVNALAWVAHTEDHHPDLQIGYKTCVVTYSTHSVGGLSENDFICASKIDGLFNG